MNLSLKRQILERPAGKKIVKVESDQFEIYDGKERIGYCGVQAGMPVSLIRDYPPSYVTKVKEYLAREVGAPSAVNCAKPVPDHVMNEMYGNSWLEDDEPDQGSGEGEDASA